MGELKPTNLDDVFATQVQSPSGIQVGQNMNQNFHSWL